MPENYYRDIYRLVLESYYETIKLRDKGKNYTALNDIQGKLDTVLKLMGGQSHRTIPFKCVEELAQRLAAEVVTDAGLRREPGSGPGPIGSDGSEVVSWCTKPYKVGDIFYDDDGTPCIITKSTSMAEFFTKEAKE